ncbi:PleD family two-component system response regulator [Pedobacter lithocola]|uniref:PleD family two-component system response regulator n=1 Tax=Pedobacter lithocola TaxID=1908239 RepID=A0ABV8P6E1_9SPHI
MNKQILVIDDDILTLEVINSMLNDEGYNVKSVHLTEMIFPSIAEFNPDLIIMDIKLNKADGRILCNQIKESENTKHIPIILLTGLDYDLIGEIICNADAIMGKPYKLDNMLLTIKNLLDSKIETFS